MDQIVERPRAEAPAGIKESLGLDDNQKTNPRRRRVLLVLGVLLLVAAGIAGVFTWRANTASQIVYTTAPIESGPLTVRISATGTLEPLTQVDISSELSGVVRDVPVDENQQVAKGDVLARLDTTRIDAQVERAEASVQAAQAKVTDAEVTLKESEQALTRSSTLSERGMVAEQALETATATRDRAQSAVETADANLAVARADLKLQQADRERSTIHSPIDGTILSRDVDPGQTVASSLQAPILFVLAQDLKSMELVAAIDEADIGSVAKGQDAEFTVDAFPGRQFAARIRDISYASTETEGVVTYEARLAVDNSDMVLRPGMTATVSVVTRQDDDVLTVPNEALRYSPPAAEEGGFGVASLFTGGFGRRHWRRGGRGDGEPSSDTRTLYVLRDGQPEAAQMKTGDITGARTEILSGLEAGDRVITASGTR